MTEELQMPGDEAPQVLDAEQVRQQLTELELEHWEYDEEEQSITRWLALRDFGQAFGFMTRVALEAERRQHHPEWFNLYNRVEISFTTHDAGGVTARDLEFARWVEDMAESTA
ncbi:MAG: hypothetical protein RLZZ22_1149 [Pseudomonadota bacterium]|jgi:4a-hydroxytetrahydrobiopterin dehydratase